MLKRFFGGLIFGAGFAVGMAIVGWLLLGFFVTKNPTGSFSVGEPFVGGLTEKASNFHELPIEKQIEKASVIALAKFEPSGDGGFKAVFTEILKQAPSTEFYYKVGDEYPGGRHYPKESVRIGDGLAVFFEGAPASMRRSMTYSGDRISGLGDMPLALFRQKCEKR